MNNRIQLVSRFQCIQHTLLLLGITLFVATSSPANEDAKKLAVRTPSASTNQTATTPAASSDAAMLELTIRILDLSWIVSVNGPIMEKALEAKGLTEEVWTSGMLGLPTRANGAQKDWPPSIPGLDSTNSLSGLNAKEVIGWIEKSWRPAVSRELDKMNIGSLPGSSRDMQTPEVMVETARALAASVGLGTNDPSAPKWPTGGGDPRVGKDSAVKVIVGEIAKALGFGERPARDLSGGGSGGGVRGRPNPDDYSTPPDKDSIWWKLVSLGQIWRKNPTQPLPVNPGPDPASQVSPRTLTKDQVQPGVGNPNIINPNPDKTQAHSTVAPPKPGTVDVAKSKGLGPDNLDPTGGRPPVPAPDEKPQPKGGPPPK